MGASLTVHGSNLYLSWIEEDQLFFASYDGASWSKPLQVQGPKRLLANWADYPKLLVRDDWLLAAWPEAFGELAYGFRFARSRDGGRTWEKPAWLHGDQTGEEYGFVSLVGAGKDKAAAIWLDGRDMRGHGMQLRYRQIGPETLGPEQVLDDRTCECCATDLIWTEHGPLAVYRDRDPKEARDIYLAAPGRPPTRLAVDNWTIPGCPVNGPALDSHDGLTVAAWFTGAGEKRLAVAASKDGGATFSAPIRFGETAIGRVDCAVTEATGFAVSWLDSDGGDQIVMLARFRVTEHGPQPLGKPRRIGSTTTGRPAGFPRLHRWRERLVLAYLGREGGIRLVSLPRLPVP